MPRFRSLRPTGLGNEFDVDTHGSRPIVTVTEDDDTGSIQLEYQFPGFTIAADTLEIDGETKDFQEVGVDGAGWLSESGRPLLPSFGRYVQIPPGCDYSIKVAHGRQRTLKGILVTPAQEGALDGEASPSLEYDAESYEEDGYYPSELVEVSGPQYLDDYRALLVHVRPLQYNAHRRVLRGYGNVTVRITLKRTPRDTIDPPANPTANLEGFGNLVLNPERRIEARLPGVSPVIRPIPVEMLGAEFLIIYDGSLKEAAARLGAWKRQRGMTVAAVSISTVGNTVAAIKQYIRSRRQTPWSRLRYVLLLGDTSAITTEQLAGATTDHYYFTKEDAAQSSDCRLPWVAGGRIPVTSKQDALSVVDQIIRYERQPPCDPEYYRRMTFAAYFQDDAPQDGKADRAYMKTMEGIRDHMVGLGFDVARVYVSNNANPQLFKDGTSVPAAAKSAIVDGATATGLMVSETSQGQLLIGHRDHGNTDGWAHPSFKDTHLKQIHSSYPSIFYSVNCLTGRFDANPSDSFAEAALKVAGGPPSLIAATEVSGTWRNDSMMKALFDAMWPGVISTFPGSTASYPVRANRLGDILAYAKSYLLVAHGQNSGVRNHFEIYHVIGDPTLQLWSGPPVVLRLEAIDQEPRVAARAQPLPDRRAHHLVER